MNCPICQLPMFQPASSFCPQCAWNLKDDPTLNTFLAHISEKDFSAYQHGVELARKNWEYLHNIKKEKVHRFANSNNGEHFYTIDEYEKDTVLQDYTCYRYEGIAFYAYPTDQPKTLPVYRFFDKDVGCHFYSLDEAEKDIVMQNCTWLYERVAFYAYPSP